MALQNTDGKAYHGSHLQGAALKNMTSSHTAVEE